MDKKFIDATFNGVNAYAGLEMVNSQSNRLPGLQLATKANMALVTTTLLTISNTFQTQDLAMTRLTKNPEGAF